MGAGASSPLHPSTYESNSKEVEPAVGDSSPVFRSARHPQLVETAFPGEVTTLYDAFQ